MTINNVLFLAAGFLWSLIITFIILYIMNRIPGLQLRTSEEGEIDGIDFDQFNEVTHDYIEFQRDLCIPLSKPPSVNSIVTVTTIRSQNPIHKQNDMRMGNIRSVPSPSDAWE